MGTINEAERTSHPILSEVEQSLQGLGIAVGHHLRPLSHVDTAELVLQAFGTGETVTREFTALIHGWTRGNPFFLEETLKALVDAGRLRWEGGQWLGWEMGDLELPGSIRDAVLFRVSHLSAAAREVAEVVAIVGARARYGTLVSVCSLDEPQLVEALEELGQRNLLSETDDQQGPLYEFQHPMVRKILVGEIGLARQRLVHGKIATALEDSYGALALDHAEELALHFTRGAIEGDAGKAVPYLAAAGRSSLERFAAQEAADHLSAALDLLNRGEARDESEPSAERFGLMEGLARARQRLGEFESAIALWLEARDDAARRGDAVGVASMERRVGLAHFYAGRHSEALAALESAATSAASDLHLLPLIRMARGVCFNMLGKGSEASTELEAALEVAERSGDRSLLARVHQALLQFHAWAGDPESAWEHGLKALALAEEVNDQPLACNCHWSMAVVAGLTAQSKKCEHHLHTGIRLAEGLRSPLLRLQFDEVAVEYANSTGDWENGIALGEKAIALARALNQQTVLPRLLVDTSMIYLGRHELERARAHLEEAWVLSGAEDAERARDIHSVIPAHAGLASYHLATGELEEAVRISEAGLAIADRTGVPVWAVHRLLPVLAEAHLRRRDLDSARACGERLRSMAERIGHVLGIAHADAIDAILTWLEGDVEKGAALMREAAAALEAAPWVADAARIRRQLAGRLADLGDREGALQVLRHVHDVFLTLGAQEELRLARVQFHELDVRPPVRPSGPGAEGLTGREVEIIRLVALRKSNKAIGRALSISPRTVTTHLSNIYRKLAISSRGELADQASELLSAER